MQIIWISEKQEMCIDYLEQLAMQDLGIGTTHIGPNTGDIWQRCLLSFQV